MPAFIYSFVYLFTYFTDLVIYLLSLVFFCLSIFFLTYISFIYLFDFLFFYLLICLLFTSLQTFRLYLACIFPRVFLYFRLCSILYLCISHSLKTKTTCHLHLHDASIRFQLEAPEHGCRRLPNPDPYFILSCFPSPLATSHRDLEAMWRRWGDCGYPWKKTSKWKTGAGHQVLQVFCRNASVSKLAPLSADDFER